MNYWLINPKCEGKQTNTMNISSNVVYMGWNHDECPKFYNEVKQGDIIVVCMGAHYNNICHYVGIADYLDEDEKCWHMKYSSSAYNEAISEIIKSCPSNFTGGESKNPWAKTKSIIQLGSNPTEQILKQRLKQLIADMNNTEIKDLLEASHNIILHGAPGTGKTFLANKIAKEIGAEIGFVQFHPSYDYTDFVEGLRPIKGDDANTIGFERRDGIFKEFCKNAIKSQKVGGNDNFEEAWENLINLFEEKADSIEIKLLKSGTPFYIILNSNADGFICGVKDQNGEWKQLYNYYINHDQLYKVYKGEKGVKSGALDNYRKAIINKMTNDCGLKKYEPGKDKGKATPYIFIIDEINRGDMSKIVGELFFSIDPGYRGDKVKIKTQYQNLVENDDVFYDGFFVPENVYIIGTMNDIDRSVESMDFAMRRRFVFKEVTAEDSATNMGISYNDSPMKRLNDKIEDKEIGLGKDYQIGGSYFLKEVEENGKKKNVPINFSDPYELDNLWNNKLHPLLKEYLRGQRDAVSKLEQLEAAYYGTPASQN